MAKKPATDKRQTVFDFGSAVSPAPAPAPKQDVVPAVSNEAQDVKVMHVNTADKDSVQMFLQRVAQGRFGDLKVSFDGSEPQLVRSCLVNLNNPEVVHDFIKAIDDDRKEYKGETINFATPLIFITHKTTPQCTKKAEDMTHFRAFTAAARGNEISIGSSLLNCPTNPSMDNNSFSSVVLVNEMQLSKEISPIAYEPAYYYLGLNALHAQRETVLAKTRDTPRRRPEEFLQVPKYQPRLA